MITTISVIIAFISGALLGITIGLLLRDAARTDLLNRNAILREQLKKAIQEPDNQ